MKLSALVILLLFSSSVHASDYMTLSWNYTVKEIISGIDAADLNGNGEAEVVAVDSSEGAIYVLDKDGSLVWKHDIRSILRDVYIVDLDNDGYSEVLTNTYGNLFLIDHSGSRKWKFKISQAMGIEESEPEEYIAVGNLNKDALKEIIIRVRPSRCTDNSVISINASGYRMNTYKIGVYDANTIEVADLDNDGVDEILLGTRIKTRFSAGKSCEPSRMKPAKVIALYANGSTLWEYPTESAVTTLFVSDIDDDAYNEILVGTYQNLIVLDRKGKLIWRQSAINPPVAGLSAIDLDGDGKKEIIIGSDNVYAFSHEGKVKWKGDTGSRVYTLRTVDLNGDGSPEIIAGSDRLYVFDNAGNLLWNSGYHTAIHELAIADLNGDGYAEVLVGSKKGIYAFETGVTAKKQLAMTSYSDAKTLYTKKNFTGALELALRAKHLYSDMGLLEEASKALKLVTEINSTYTKILNLSEEGRYYLNESKNYYVSGNYLDASKHAHLAKIKFSNSPLKVQDLIDESEKLINNSNSFLRINATQSYEMAQNLLSAEKYESAKEYAIWSKTLYEYLRDSEGVEKADAIMGQISSKRGVGSRFQNFLSGILASIKKPLSGFDLTPKSLLTVGGAVLILVVFVMAIQFALMFMKRKKVPKLRLGAIGGGEKPKPKESERQTQKETESEEKSKEPEPEEPKEPERPRVIRERGRFTRDSSRGAGLTIPK